MKINTILLYGLIITILYTSTIYAAPAIQEIAINKNTKECAGYWSGDEFVSYNLPEGWISYPFSYPDQYGNDETVVKTDIGTCKEFRSKKDCCKQLGYKYVSDNIGKTNKQELIPGNNQTPKQNIISKIIAAIINLFNKKPEKSNINIYQSQE